MKKSELLKILAEAHKSFGMNEHVDLLENLAITAEAEEIANQSEENTNG